MTAGGGREGMGRAEGRVTWLSVWVNTGLTALKFAAGIFGNSQALLADAIHSLSDFATDFAVLVGVKLARKPKDADHAYGHGKYETLAAALIGAALAVAAGKIGWDALQGIADAVRGEPPAPAAGFAFWAAVASAGAKEWLYHLTMRVAKATGSSALAANAWHHRSDAFSSVATAVGVGAGVFFGADWAVLDPVAALFVAVVLLRVGWRLVGEQLGSLTDQSLSPEACAEILAMARAVEGIEDPHNLRTRMVGRYPVIDLHVRMREDLPLKEAHEIATRLERALKARFGAESIATLHLEPVKTSS